MPGCQKDNCRQRYIGTTGRQLIQRLAEHRGYITNQVLTKATGAHWNLPGHSLADLRASVLEQSKYNFFESKYVLNKNENNKEKIVFSFFLQY